MDLASRTTPYSSDEVRRLNRYTYHPNGKRMCSKCHQVKNLDSENYGVHRYYYDDSGEIKSVGYDGFCKPCMIDKRVNHNRRIKEDPRRYCGKLIPQLRFRAKEQGVPFDLSTEDLYKVLESQNFLCKHTGTVLDFSLKSKGNYPHRDFPSVDKMDPKRGYVAGNIAWVVYSINRMKSDLTEEEFISFCHNISRRYGG